MATNIVIARADEAVGAQQNNDGRRVDHGEDMRQLANHVHAGVNCGSSS
jgi:hypothetical protein